MENPVTVHKITLCIVDHGDCGIDEITDVLENQKYPNWCINPQVFASDERVIDWDDSHPLNQRKGWKPVFEEMFK